MFNNHDLTLFLPGVIVPKARPRIVKGHAYLPKPYRDWKDKAIEEIRQQLPLYWQPWEMVSVAIDLENKRQRGDLDNIAGALLDALVQAGAIIDDRIGCVKALSIQVIDEPTDRMATIQIKPW